MKVLVQWVQEGLRFCSTDKLQEMLEPTAPAVSSHAVEGAVMNTGLGGPSYSKLEGPDPTHPIQQQHRTAPASFYALILPHLK